MHSTLQDEPPPLSWLGTFQSREAHALLEKAIATETSGVFGASSVALSKSEVEHARLSLHASLSPGVPLSAGALFYAAGCQRDEQGSPKEAQALYREGVRLAPCHGPNLYRLATHTMRGGGTEDLEAAIAWLHRALATREKKMPNQGHGEEDEEASPGTTPNPIPGVSA